MTRTSKSTGGRSAVDPNIDAYMIPVIQPPPPHADLPVRDEHPVMKGKYLLITDEMIDLYEKMKTVIKTGYSGAIIYGSASVGKTHAVGEITKWFEKDEELVLAVFLITLADRNYKYKEFYQYISTQVGCQLPTRTNDVGLIIENLVSHLVAYGKRNNDTVVFILDESEHLLDTHYNYLKFIYNRLASEGVRLITFLVGTERLLKVQKDFKNNTDSDAQIIRRFMQRTHEYKGIGTKESLVSVLNGFDTSEYGGKTFTEYFFPEAWDKGLRLTDLADDMLKAMLEISGLKALPNIPIGRLLTVINGTLQTFGKYSTVKDASGKSYAKEWVSKEDMKMIMFYHDFHTELIDLSARTIKKGR